MQRAHGGPDLVVLYEHPKWQQPLFDALERRGVAFATYDLKSASFGDADLPAAPLYFNQASPSAYVRGNTRAVPYCLALMEDLEAQGARVLNGSRAFRLELSKIAQVRLMKRLGIAFPRSVAFNDPAALRARADELVFPAILKPNQGGSGARMFEINSLDELDGLLEAQPELWLPDNLLLLQEYLEHDPETSGIIRLEILGGELLYAMRVKSGGGFNLCPSEVCNPDDGEGTCEVDFSQGPPAAPPEFEPYPDVPREAVEAALAIFNAGGLDVGGIEYLETVDGRRVFYDVNANSNLRRPIGLAMGFDPFERVVDFLEGALSKC